VYTIGQPNGKRWDMSAGGDRITRAEAIGFAFRSSSVAPGSSGGALFNAQRLLIGLVQKDVPPSAEAIRIDVVIRVLRAEKYAVAWQRPVADATQSTDMPPPGGGPRGAPVAPADPTTGRSRAGGPAPSPASAGRAIGGRMIAEEPRTGSPIAIANSKSRLCLTIAGGGTAQNATAVQYTCDTDPSRFWVSTAVDGRDVVQLRNLKSGLCLTIAGGGTARNATAVQYTCDDDPSRRWRAIRGDGGSYVLVNVNSGLCLTVAGGGTDQNLAAVQFPCDGDRSRDWRFIPAR
jgi:cytolethal distending toxin subunit A